LAWQVHWQSIVSANSTDILHVEHGLRSASWTPFRVARPVPTVANWAVLSEALRRIRRGEEAREVPAATLRDLLRTTRSASVTDAAPTKAENTEVLPLAFEEVFRRYAPYVGAVVLQLIGRPGDVDDVVQDVFIQAHRGLSKLRDPSAVRPWLRRIAVRRARRWLRTRWVRRWFGESDVDAQVDLTDASATPEERAQIAHVYRMLERMPRDERIVWVLRIVEGETLESVAELLGCSVSTVQRRLRAAQAIMGEIR
jgi:RNA polymerase sigma-70 factor (ECF subfamily)